MVELRSIEVPACSEGPAAGSFLAQFLAAQSDGVSRSRVQLLIDQGDVLVNGAREKASLKLRGGERIEITGEPLTRRRSRPPPRIAIRTVRASGRAWSIA